MADPIVIWGAGAIGGTIGAYLVRAGHRVIFVDVVPEHVASIARGELKIEGPIANFMVGGEAVTPDRFRGVHKTFLLAVKANHTAQAVRTILPHLAEDGGIVSLQNGLNEFIIADIAGRTRTIGAFVNFSADWLEPGRITYGARSPLVVGELDGRISPRVEALHRVLLDFESDTHASDNVMGYVWGKTAYACFLASSALTNAPMVEFMQDPQMRGAITGIIREVLGVAVAEGVRPQGFQGYDPDAFLSGDAEAMDRSIMANCVYKQKSAKKHSGYWRDLAVRKRPTDITSAVQPVQHIAKRHGLTTPLVDKLLSLIGAIERGEVEIGRPLAEDLSRVAAQHA